MWPLAPIGGFCEVFDGPHATPPLAAVGPVFLGISSLVDGRLDLSQSHFVSEEDYVRWTRRVTPQPGDIVFSYETRLGQAALIPDGLRCCLGRRMGLLRPKTERVLPEFLLYAFLSPEFQATIRRNTVKGSTVDRILLTELEGFPVRVPDNLDEQQFVVNVLSALDRKIRHNETVSATLSKAAVLTFWRVAAGATRMPLAEIADVTMGSSPPGETYNKDGNGLPFFQGIRDFGDKYPNTSVWCSKPVRVARDGDVLISVRAPVGTLNVATSDCCIGRGIAAARSKRHPHTLFQALRSDPAIWQPFKREGTVFGAVGRKDLSAVKIVWPDEADTETALSAIDIRNRAALAETAVLKKARSRLLPILLAGAVNLTPGWLAPDA